MYSYLDCDALATDRKLISFDGVTALSDLFSHYMDAWKSWYVEVAGSQPIQLRSWFFLSSLGSISSTHVHEWITLVQNLCLLLHWQGRDGLCCVYILHTPTAVATLQNYCHLIWWFTWCYTFNLLDFIVDFRCIYLCWYYTALLFLLHDNVCKEVVWSRRLFNYEPWMVKHAHDIL